MKKLKIINSTVFSVYILEMLFAIALALMSYFGVLKAQGTSPWGDGSLATAIALSVFAVLIVVFGAFAILKLICVLLKLWDLIKNKRAPTIACMVFDVLFLSLYSIAILETSDGAYYVVLPFLAISLISFILNTVSLFGRLRNPLKYCATPFMTSEEHDG